MSTTIYKYRIPCTTTSTYEYVWSETTPTTCPVNTGHTIDSANIIIVDKVEKNVVTIAEETIPTQGYYRAKGDKLLITNATPGSITTKTITRLYRQSLLEGWFFTETNQIGDYIEAFVAPNTVIGAITAPVTVGATTFSVSPTVFQNIAIGFSIKLSDGTNIDDVGECIGIDTGNSTITVETPTINSFSPLTPTYVLLTVKIIEGFYINSAPVKFEFAQKKLGGKTLPPGVPLVIYYHNLSGGTKSLSYCLELIY